MGSLEFGRELYVPTSASAKGIDAMTDKAIDTAAKTLFENTPIVGNRSWQWCCDKLPALAEKWRVCARAAIVAYEKVRWDEAMGRYRDVIDRQRDRPLPPPPGKEGSWRGEDRRQWQGYTASCRRLDQHSSKETIKIDGGPFPTFSAAEDACEKIWRGLRNTN